MSSRHLVAGLVASAMTLLVACTSSESSTNATRIGAQYVAVAGHLAARTTTLRTVQGVLDVRVGTPRQSIVEVGSARSIDAPSDGSFVAVELEQGSSAAVPQTGEPVYPVLRVSLMADGRAYPIDLDRLERLRSDNADGAAAATRSGSLPTGAAYLAVAGRPTTLAVRVDQAGRTQSVDARTGRRDAGNAAVLYADPRPMPTRSCGEQKNPTPVVPDYRPCSISYERTPWLGGRGFAPAGQSWLVARLDIGTNTGVRVRGGDDLDFQLDTSPRVTAVWSGKQAVRVGLGEDPKYATLGDDATVVFLVPADRDAGGVLSITATYRLEGFLADKPVPGARVGQDVPVRWQTVIR